MAKQGTSGMFHEVPSGVKPSSRGGSAPQNTSVGSGSRPTRSKIGIESSAPSNPHTLDRNPPSPLK